MNFEVKAFLGSKKERKKCSNCGGSGHCPECAGQGYYEVGKDNMFDGPMGRPTERWCPFCEEASGWGDCIECHGEGYIK